MMYILVVVCAALVLHSSQGRYTVPSTCKPIQSIPLCQSLPYNMTKLPNKLGHHTLKEVNDSINDYKRLLDAQCSDSLEFLLCVYHLPICTMEPEFFDKPILPCRSVCRQVKRDCSFLISRFASQQPRRDVDCNDLPAYETGVCVKPEVFIRGNGDSGDPSTIRALDMGVCQCHAAVTSMDNRKFHSKGYKFAIRARVILINQTAPDSHRTIVVNVRKVLKEGAVKISRGTLRLHTNTSCACPQVKLGEMYLMIGYEDSSRQELILDENSFVKVWKTKKFSGSLRNMIDHWKRRSRAKNNKRGKKKSNGN